MDNDDQECLAAYRRGDVEAFGRLQEKHRRSLFGYVYGLTGNMADAEDLYQEVWFRAIRKLSGYRHRNFRGWLMRIAHNAMVDRARRRKPLVSLTKDPEEGGRSFEETLAGSDAGPAAAAAGKDLGRRIERAIADLPDEQREVFVLRTVDETAFKDIARIQGVSINTALARMQYALRKMRAALEDEYRDLGVRI